VGVFLILALSNVQTVARQLLLVKSSGCNLMNTMLAYAVGLLPIMVGETQRVARPWELDRKDGTREGNICEVRSLCVFPARPVVSFAEKFEIGVCVSAAGCHVCSPVRDRSANAGTLTVLD